MENITDAEVLTTILNKLKTVSATVEIDGVFQEEMWNQINC